MLRRSSVSDFGAAAVVVGVCPPAAADKRERRGDGEGLAGVEEDLALLLAKVGVEGVEARCTEGEGEE
jgi:hypothetical protein